MYLSATLVVSLLSCLMGPRVWGFDSSLHYDVWKTSPHENCNKFNGCLTMQDREETYLNPNATSIPCGFLAPSDLDRVKEYFSKDHVCKLVVYTVVFGAYGMLYNPISKTNYISEDKSICFFAFIDKETVNNGLALQHVIAGGANPGRNKKSAITGSNSWQPILISSLPYESPTHSMKAIKLSGPMLFPNAEWLVWYDAKYILYQNPWRLVQFADSKMGRRVSVAMTQRFFDPLDQQFRGAQDRLVYLNYTHKFNPRVDSEIQEIRNQKHQYMKEGLFDRNKGRLDLLVDSAIMIIRNDVVARRFYCGWANEVAMFSRRDQLSEYVVEEHLKIPVYRIVNEKHLFFKSVGHVPTGVASPVSPKYMSLLRLHPSTYRLDS
mmetsp:Transcript_2704/g.4065  ORF Transcript_2704/g.4065 Transcript_2704/m.4065 type:complete len:379 (-) Transcript_2704:66-1202(-)